MTPNRVLAERLIPGESLLSELARIVAANILMVLCAWIVIPLSWTPVPVTGQTFGVLLVAVLFGARRSAVVMVLYLLEGAAGLPVFQPLGLPGLARFLGPTAGYLLAYPVAAFVTGWLAGREKAVQPIASPGEQTASTATAWGANLRLLFALLAGEVVIFTGGCTWLAVGVGQGWRLALVEGLLPFIPVELIKVALVMAAVRGTSRFRRQQS
jgi:biotin transport system substrate-specific component